MTNYILNEQGEPVLCDDVIVWARWLESADRTVAKDSVGDVDISTVFLGLDHGFVQGEDPVLWETMIFGGPLSKHKERYTSLAAAKSGHARWIVEVMRCRR